MFWREIVSGELLRSDWVPCEAKMIFEGKSGAMVKKNKENGLQKDYFYVKNI